MEIKQALPVPLRKGLGRIRRYLQRLRVWSSVCFQVKGETKDDRAAIRSALLRAPLRSLEGLDEWQNPTTDRDCAVRVEGIGRFRVRAHSDDLYHVLPAREPAILSVLRERLTLGGTFVDAGANIGFYTVLASKLVGDRGLVLAIEMMPETADILRDHLDLNAARNVQVLPFAISDTGGRNIVATVEHGHFGQASIVNGRGQIQVQVETARLADILQDVETVDLLKLDLEGAEEQAVEGLWPAIDKVNAIVFEDWGDSAVSRRLRSAGFGVTRLDGNNSLAVRETVRDGR